MQGNKSTQSKFDLKLLLKARHKVILKKFVRVHILQEEATGLLRRYSFELEDTPSNLPLPAFRRNICLENQNNFNIAEENQKKSSTKMKKINKLDFRGFRLHRPEDDDVTQLNIEYIKRTEKNKKTVSSLTAIEKANGSIASTNVAARGIQSHPGVTFKGVLKVAIGNPTGYNDKFVIIIGYRVYVFESELSNSALIAFEVEPREVEKFGNMDPGYFILKSSMQPSIYVLQDRNGLQVLLSLEDSVGYACMLHTFDMLGTIKSMTHRLSEFYNDYGSNDFHCEKLQSHDYGLNRQEYNYSELDIAAERSTFIGLKPIKFHPGLSEISIVNLPLSTRCIDFIFDVVGKRKMQLQVVRLEYNEYQVDSYSVFANYFKDANFKSLKVFSMSGNKIGDKGLVQILDAINQRLDV